MKKLKIKLKRLSKNLKGHSKKRMQRLKSKKSMIAKQKIIDATTRKLLS